MSITIACTDVADDVAALYPEHGRPVNACNFANANAYPVLAIMTDRNPLISDLSYGELLPSGICDAIERVAVALGSDADAFVARAPMLRAPSVDHSHDGTRCRVIHCGSDDERACDRLRAVLTVLTSALTRGVGVRWS